jgi:hypothetical protein
MTTTPAITATVLRTTEWGPMFDGQIFRVAVMEVCPSCGTAEAHAVEIQDQPELSKCWVCNRLVTLPVDEAPEPELITSYEALANHTRDTCTNKPRCTEGRDCDERLNLYSAMSRDEARCRTPYKVTRVTRYETGYVETRNLGRWSQRAAEATAATFGGTVVDQTHLYRIN